MQRRHKPLPASLEETEGHREGRSRWGGEEAKAGRGGSTGQGRLLVYPAPRSVQIRLPRESQGDAEAKSLLCPSRCRRWDCGSQNLQEAGLGVQKGHT